jgi:hypothetical protein
VLIEPPVVVVAAPAGVVHGGVARMLLGAAMANFIVDELCLQ